MLVDPGTAESGADARAILMMGVSGAGKSCLGSQLAARLGAPFLEGDALHPAANRRKIRRVRPLEPRGPACQNTDRM